jgi:hypothetical protein
MLIYSPRHFVFIHLQLFSSLRLLDQVSRPYKKICEIISYYLHILIYRYTKRRLRNKDSELNDRIIKLPECNLHMTSDSVSKHMAVTIHSPVTQKT